jgi:protein O-GlcNAc transferase
MQHVSNKDKGTMPLPGVPATLEQQKTAAEANACCQRGIKLFQQGKFAEAAVELERAVALRPNDAGAVSNLANIEFYRGDVDRAIAGYLRALELKPDFAEAHNNLGSALEKQGRLTKAIAHWHEALRLRPAFAEPHNNLANALLGEDKAEDAAVHCRHALRIRPAFPEALNNLGIALQKLGKLEEASDCFYQALHFHPHFAQAYNNLANVLARQGKLEDAAHCYQQASQIKPDLADARNNLGCVLLREGWLDLALTSFREALRLRPNFAAAQSNIVACSNYLPDADPDAVFAEHRRWGEQQLSVVSCQLSAKKAQTGMSVPPRTTDNSQLGTDNYHDPERCLRIGYVSPDLRNHALSRYFEPVLANHDSQHVEAFCYAEVEAPDAVTSRLQSYSKGWCWTCRLTDAQLVQRIGDDGIDILVDLAGHTSGNRLGVFARRAAPVQVTWLGYMNTTGLTTVDYRLTDDILDPPGQPTRDTEELLRLPGGMCCFAPSPDAPPVAPLRALKRGHLTFGSLQGMVKLNSKVFDLWTTVLKALPTSHLLMFRDTLNPAAQEHIRREFVLRGISEKRLDLRRGFNTPGYLGVLGEIDIGLDTFPCTGGVSTCESLWMGVPVITLCGVRPASRNSAAILTRAGLADWVAHTPEEFVSIAMKSSQGIGEIAQLRTQLRDRTGATLCDGKRFTRELEDAYRSIWRRLCVTSRKE